jgi:hypothetical protein
MDAIRTRDALAVGMPRASLYSSRYHRPFHGIRMDRVPQTHVELCRAAVLALPPAAAFSHRSAAVLHGIPLPHHALPREVEVSVLEPHRSPRRAGIRSHQLTPGGQRVVSVDGLRCFSPEDAWIQLSASLSLEDLVVAGDFLITGAEPYSGDPAPITRAHLEGALRRHGRHRGVRSLRLALERIRYGSLSPQETRLRLAMEDAGLPSCEPNYRVTDENGHVGAMIDLAFPAYSVAVEYLGDHHRATAAAYHKDIERREWLADRGWHVVFVTGGDDLAAAARRVRAALRAASGRDSPIY